MMKGMIKKAKLALLGLLMAAAPYAGCGGGGVPVKGDYPKLTPEIKSRLEESVLELVENNTIIVENNTIIVGNKEVSVDAVLSDESGFKEVNNMPFDGVPKELINYFIDFTQEDYIAKDISMPGLEGVTLSLLSQEEVEQACGADATDAGGCNSSGHIILIETGIRWFFSLFSHEFGHQLYPSNLEFPSVANQTYSPIKLYEFSKKIGSPMIHTAFQGCYPSPLEEIDPFLKMYAKGRVFSVVNLKDYEADIEQAMKHVTLSRLLALEARVDRAVSEYGTSVPQELCFGAWESLLSSPQFALAVTNIGHGLTLSEARELAEYMRLLNYNVSRQGNNDRDDEYHNMVEEFLRQDFVSNPYFKAHAVAWLTERSYNGIDELTVRGELVSDEIYGFARKIIDANQDYPCTIEDPYECPKVIRGIRPHHAFAYYVADYAGFKGIDEGRKLESLDNAIDFITKFYPDVDFLAGDFSSLAESNVVQTDSYVPLIATHAGVYAFRSGDLDLAKKFFTAAVTMRCNKDVRRYTADMSCEVARGHAEDYLRVMGY